MSYAENAIALIDSAIDNLQDKIGYGCDYILSELEKAKEQCQFHEDEIQDYKNELDELREENERFHERACNWANSDNLQDISLRETIDRLFDSGYTALEIEQSLLHLPIKTL